MITYNVHVAPLNGCPGTHTTYRRMPYAAALELRELWLATPWPCTVTITLRQR